MKALAAELAGRAAAAAALSSTGADGLAAALDADLPAFAAVPKPASGKILNLQGSFAPGPFADK